MTKIADHMIIPTTEQKGFSAEQKKYLAEMLVKLNIHLAVGGGQQADQEEPPQTFWGTQVEDLSKEERAKYETHVLDIWDDIVKHNDANKIAEGITQFMFRHYGIFNVEPNSPGYMCRLRIPSCKLRGDQLARLADVAADIGGGYAHVTTRGNFQIREIAPNRVLDLFAALYDMGLSCKGTGADSARNITASPTAGFDPVELIDLHKYGLDLSHRILNTRDMHGLPRKFNFSFDNSGSISCVADTNDVGFIAVKVLENDQNVEPGIYCRLMLGGITGHKDFARDTGFICKPEQTPEISMAILRVFLEHGDRTNRKKARFKYVLDEHGFDWVCKRIQEKLNSFGNGVELIPLAEKFDAPRPPVNRQGHIGVHPQSQPGLNYIGVALKLGYLSPEQMHGLAKIAQQYGQNDVRLTVWQNLLIPHVADENVAAACQAIEALGLGVSATSFAAGAVACTGRWGCKLANAYTKQDGTAIVEHLEARFELDQPINIHLTGCPNSCAQHYIGDLGFIGTAAPDGSEGYNIFIGGGTDTDRGLARFLCGPIAARDVCSLTEKIVGNYLATRKEREAFLAFSRRHDETQLQTILLAD
ncbi:NirA family protein [Catenovulum sp. 2E275]|uniref:NirA family protein n=1 Tax=Catenovulum sp. 2E275 TaxID=2980497 RepID=UPI0021D1F25E|nr:NirA family protein [Catenovulum sp. 2E275]MCU4676150.1 NirA family protein [Catenovulum sp. 2E275]